MSEVVRFVDDLLSSEHFNVKVDVDGVSLLVGNIRITVLLDRFSNNFEYKFN